MGIVNADAAGAVPRSIHFYLYTVYKSAGNPANGRNSHFTGKNGPMGQDADFRKQQTVDIEKIGGQHR